MVGSDDNRRRDEYSPISVKCQKGQRAEDMEVSFDATAGQVNQQRGHQHLRGCDYIARRLCTRELEGQDDRKETNRPAEEDRSPNVDMCLTGGAPPRER